MTRIWNPYTFTPLGNPIVGEAPPVLRVMGGMQATAQQLSYAQQRFTQFVMQARLSTVPNPTEAGRLPDGTQYRIVKVGPQTTMEIWPSGGEEGSSALRPGIWFRDPVAGSPGSIGLSFYVLSPPKKGQTEWAIHYAKSWPSEPVKQRSSGRFSMTPALSLVNGLVEPAADNYFYPLPSPSDMGTKLQQLGGYVGYPVAAVALPGTVRFCKRDANQRGMFVVGGDMPTASGLYLFRSMAAISLTNTGLDSGVKPNYAPPAATYPAITLAYVKDIYAPPTSTFDELNTRTLLAQSSDGGRIAVQFARSFDRLPAFAGPQLKWLAGWGPLTAIPQSVAVGGVTYYRVDARVPSGVSSGNIRYQQSDESLRVFDSISGSQIQSHALNTGSLTPKTPVRAFWDAGSSAASYSAATGGGVNVVRAGPSWARTSGAHLFTPGSGYYGSKCVFTVSGPLSYSVSGERTTHELMGPFFQGDELVPLVAQTHEEYSASGVGSYLQVNEVTESYGEFLPTPKPLPEYPSSVPWDGPSSDAGNQQSLMVSQSLDYRRASTVEAGRFGTLALILERTQETYSIDRSSVLEDSTRTSSLAQSSSYDWTVERRSILAFDPDMDLLCYAEFSFNGSGSVSMSANSTNETTTAYSFSAGMPLPDLPLVRVVIKCRGRTITLQTPIASVDEIDRRKLAAAQLHPLLGLPYGAPAIGLTEYLAGQLPMQGAWTFPSGNGEPFMGDDSAVPPDEIGGTPVNVGIPTDGFSLKTSEYSPGVEPPDAYTSTCSKRGSFPQPTLFMDSVQATYVRSPDGKGAYLHLQCATGIPESVRGFTPQAFVVDARGIRSAPVAQLRKANVDLSMAGPF